MHSTEDGILSAASTCSPYTSLHNCGVWLRTCKVHYLHGALLNNHKATSST